MWVLLSVGGFTRPTADAAGGGGVALKVEAPDTVLMETSVSFPAS